jgi:transcriptional regulator with XRE-family HTH domain
VNPATVLRTARARHGLTQAQVAARAGTSQPVISAYEHGRRDPGSATLRRLVAATGEHLELRLAETVSDLPPPASIREHADRLAEVLSLADAVPTRARPRRLDAPRMVSIT